MTASPSRTVSALELAALLNLKPPTPEQVEVIESPLAPSVIVAGAGSGKTETMAARVLWLVANQRVAPDAVLGLTFTRKAAAELGQRIRRRLTQWRYVLERERSPEADRQAQLAALVAGEPTVLTYSAFAGRLVAEHAMRIGKEPGARLLSQAVCWQLADSVVRRYRGALPADIGALASVSQYLLALAGQLADHLLTPEQVEDFAAGILDRWEALPTNSRGTQFPGDTGKFVQSTLHRTELMKLVREFESAKKALPAVDFGDQMSLAARLAEVADVGAIERGRYGAVLLDEFQDTGHSQLHLLSGLFGAGHPVTAVGDPFQSIYGWRGASAGNIRRFAETFRSADDQPATVFQLSTSWRNDARILAAANAVADPLRAHDPSAVTLRPRIDAPAGVVRATMRETVEDEAAWVAGELAQQWSSRPVGERTAAVLVRRRSQIAPIHDALLERGLPVEVVGLGGLLTTPEVVDVVATLRVLADHKSASALARILTGARWRIGPSDLAALNRRARLLVIQRQPPGSPVADGSDEDDPEPPSLVEALDDLGHPDGYSAVGYRRLHALGDELRGLRRRLAAPLAELVGEVERIVGIDVEVSAHPGRVRTGRIHLDRFLDEAARFSLEADQATLTAFLAFLEAAEAEENGLEAGEAVVEKERIQILTVHGAKGLEWDVVAVPGLLSDIFPAPPKSIDWTRTRQALPFPLRGDRGDLPRLDLSAAADRGELAKALTAHGDQVKRRHLDEERRLAYVAFTRARSVLLASGYAWDTAIKARQPSIFLTELAEHADVDEWFGPAPDADNPRLAEVRAAQWPIDPLAGRRPDVVAGAELVRAALADSDPQNRTGPAEATVLPGLFDDPADRASAWRRDVDLLLAERARQTAGGAIPVSLPSTLSVSQLVVLGEDPDELARRLRRPVPARPAPWARRGTAFHAWLETRWSAQTLLDVDDLPGAADESAAAWLDTDELAELQVAFEASEWAARTPLEVEVPFEMAVGSVVIRGRMDAVFGTAVGGEPAWTVVDWKTGRRPTGARAEAAAIQLAAYRIAWARLNGLGEDQLHRVRAAFHYVRDNVTVAPVDLLDGAGLAALINGS